ncbi:MAG TPA: phosphopantothenoylcysteine decarboxylase [Phycisphaerales bacterium]|nr:phosphopantothenoylcysteine decarboxylase [Phycisphaerales bacterium]
MGKEPKPPLRMLVTAGPTHEPIDAVRYLANRSSGRMGMAIAQAAASRGTPCTLLLGPTPLNSPVHSQIQAVRFQSTADLEVLLRRHWPDHDVLVMAAAVADFRPANAKSGEKIKRTSAGMTLELEATPDLLAGIAPFTRPNQLVVGFALEPADRLISSAMDKLTRKKMDAIVANPLETMDSPDVRATVMFRNGSAGSPSRIDLPPMSKELFATWLVDRVLRIAGGQQAMNG